MNELLAKIDNIVRIVEDKFKSLRIFPNQIEIIHGISDISKRLGLFRGGEFRLGNSNEPGFGFTGLRLGFPFFEYSGYQWSFAVVTSDVLMAGVLSTGDFVYGNGQGNAQFKIQGAAGYVRDLIFSTGVLPRWIIRTESTAESGSNVGSDLQIVSHADDGSLLEIPFFIKRSTGNIGIGTTAPADNVLFHLFSTTKAFKAPVMTTTQRNAIVSPTQGMMIYNTTTKTYNWHDGTSWQSPSRTQAVTVTGSSTHTVLNTDEVVVFTATCTATLPAADGGGHTVRLVDRTGTLTVEGNGSDTIKGSLTQTLSAGEDIILTDTATGIWE